MSWPLVFCSLLLAQQAPAADAKATQPAAAELKAESGQVKAVADGKTARAAAAPAPQTDSGLSTIVLLAPCLLFLWFLWIRPQGQQEKKRKLMLDAMKKNDKVLTTAGIYGTIVSVDTASDKVVVRVDDDKGVKFTFTKAGIARVIEPTAEKTTQAEV